MSGSGWRHLSGRLPELSRETKGAEPEKAVKDELHFSQSLLPGYKLYSLLLGNNSKLDFTYYRILNCPDAQTDLRQHLLYRNGFKNKKKCVNIESECGSNEGPFMSHYNTFSPRQTNNKTAAWETCTPRLVLKQVNVQEPTSLAETQQTGHNLWM